MKQKLTLAGLILLATLGGALSAQAASVAERLILSWPDTAHLRPVEVRSLHYPTDSPFTFKALGEPRKGSGFNAAVASDQARASARLFLPPEASVESPVPAVVLLHGAGGVLDARELTYAKQFANMGVAALVIDVFGARPKLDTGYLKRLLNITEAMFMADAYAGLKELSRMPEIDARRVALIGFSYGGMASLFAAYDQVAARYGDYYGQGEHGPSGLRFAAHVSYYAPCIARFDNSAATGAPILMLWGGQDATVDPERCREIADDLRRGGAGVQTIEFPDAHHQWDGGAPTPRRVERGLSRCSFRVADDGRVTGKVAGTPFSLPMTNSYTRKAILLLCSDRAGYMVGEMQGVRSQSNEAVGRFLWGVFNQITESHVR